MQVAHLEKAGHYTTIKDGEIVTRHPSSCLDGNPQWILYHEFLITSKTFVRTLMNVQGKWLLEVAPKYYNNVDQWPNSPTKQELQRIRDEMPPTVQFQ